MFLPVTTVLPPPTRRFPRTYRWSSTTPSAAARVDSPLLLRLNPENGITTYGYYPNGNVQTVVQGGVTRS